MIICDKSTRTGRFLDPTNPFQKIPDHERGFESTFHYKHVSHLISLQFYKILKMLHNELIPFIPHHLVKGKRIFRAQKKKLDRSHCIAVTAYTMDEKVNGKKLYLDFNDLEMINPWKSFPYKSLYALLARTIYGIDINPDVTTQIYYRGLKCKVTDVKEDDCVYSAQFLSCTTDKNVALQFISSTDDNAEGTLMVYEGSALCCYGLFTLPRGARNFGFSVEYV